MHCTRDCETTRPSTGCCREQQAGGRRGNKSRDAELAIAPSCESIFPSIFLNNTRSLANRTEELRRDRPGSVELPGRTLPPRTATKTPQREGVVSSVLQNWCHNSRITEYHCSPALEVMSIQPLLSQDQLMTIYSSWAKLKRCPGFQTEAAT